MTSDIETNQIETETADLSRNGTSSVQKEPQSAANISYALPQPSIKPILIFLACLVVVVAAGLTFMSVTSSSVNQSAVNAKFPFKTISGNSFLIPIIQNDEPPSNVMGSLAFPLDTTITNKRVGTVNQYDANLILTTKNISPGKLFSTLSIILKSYKWKIISNQVQNSNDLLIGSIAGNDGFFWTVGFTIPIVQNNDSANSTQYKMSLFQQSDGG